MMLIRMLLKDKFFIVSLISIPVFIWIGFDVESNIAMVCMVIGVAVHMNIVWSRIEFCYKFISTELAHKRFNKKFDGNVKILDEVNNHFDPKN